MSLQSGRPPASHGGLTVFSGLRKEPRPKERRDDLDPRTDPRKRLCVLLGDGFSKAYLDHYGLSSLIWTTPLLPAPADYLYHPSEFDRFDRGPLWDRVKFPRVHRWWEEHRAQHPSDRTAFGTLCTELATTLAVDVQPGYGIVSLGM